MSILYLIRHGQATTDGGDYDRLSPLGVDQSRALGEMWAGGGQSFDRVFVGPRRRQRQTCDAVGEIYRRRRLVWPEPETLAELDEHCGPELAARLTPDLETPGLTAEAKLLHYLEEYRAMTRRWARGELSTPPDLEPWAAFRARVEAGLGQITDGDRRGRSVAVFTSGGTVAAAVGLALALADEKIIELSWRVRNAAVSELLFSTGRSASRRSACRRLTLHTFNTTAHLREPRLVTYI